MGDELSLLLRLRGDNTQARATLADTRVAVNQLRESLGPEFTQTATKTSAIFSQTFADIGDSIENLVRGRVPVVGDLLGEALGGVTSGIEKNAKSASEKVDTAVNLVANSLGTLSTASGKSIPQLTSFLKTFGQLKTDAERNEAAFKAFGGSVDLVGNKTAKFLPELKEASAAMNTASTEAALAASSFTSLLGPLALAAAALTAEIAVVVSLTKEIFELARASADYQGKLFDFSQQVGVSVETLSALEVAALQTGGSIDGVVQSLGIFQKKLEESAENEGSKAANTLRRLGVDATDTEAAFRQAVTALARMPEGFRQTATAMELFGRGGKAVLAVAKESQGDIDKVIDRLRDLGLVTSDQAKLADEFNDQLVLLQVQLRGIGTVAIPVVLDALRDISKLLEENRDLFRVLQGVVAAAALSIRVGFSIAKQRLEEIQTVLALTVAAFQKIKESVEYIVGHPITVPNPFGSQPPPAEPPITTEPQRDPFTEKLKDEVDARKRLQAVLNVELAERQRQAEASIALAQREFEAGRRTREQLLQATLNGTRRQTQAEIEGLENQRAINLKEIALAKDDLEKRQQLANQNLAIDTQIANKRAALRQSEADARARFEKEERRAELASQQAQLETLTNIGQQRIAVLQQLLSEERVEREAALAEIEAIENAAQQARGQLLKRELELAGIGPERQVVLDKIKALETDRAALERQQSERRKQLTREEFESRRQIILSGLDALLQVEQIQGEARIATTQAQAALRIKTEEQAAREILAVRLRLIDSEIEAVKARQTAAGSIVDPRERRAVQAQLVNELQILNAQRRALQEQGNREIDAARQEDLNNERRYVEELEDVRERTRAIELDAAEDAIRLMQSTFVRRKDIIRAQRDLELALEADRHRRATESIRRQQQETDAEIRTLEARLESLTIGTTEEIEQYERIIAALERLRLKRLELDAQQKAENERTQTRERRVTTGANRDEDEADPLGRLGSDIEDLKKFAKELEASIVPLGEILADTFNQISDAIGQTISNWVLLGETGPAVMRKILAQALASIAAEAAINAIKELALGFATLFFNPAESAAHFTAAALWGSIAGVSAIAGRAVAGDLFKQKSASSGAGGSGSSGGPDALNPIVQGRNQQQTITIILRPDESAFGRLVTATVVDDIGNGGVIREVINSDGR